MVVDVCLVIIAAACAGVAVAGIPALFEIRKTARETHETLQMLQEDMGALRRLSFGVKETLMPGIVFGAGVRAAIGAVARLGRRAHGQSEVRNGG